ncbi:MAG TPA: pyridoxamine 5'-phosphate oxidase [Actinomycetes bacterium]|jgi:pyridoxamine 5'-phosphate oxidase|nr:pyridoxamine 5'-phosphate oxidase [Actinomycetes bacterium]
MRREYTREALAEADVDADPVVQFGRWFEQAEQAGLLEPTAMTLATATPDGRPSARMVLLRGFDERGFCFYTNHESRKGVELAANPRAALVFWWGELERQVRIEGPVAPTSRAESEAYFHSRPPGSQLSAAASPQSRVIQDRAVLERRVAELAADSADGQVPLPDFWGGYRLTHEVVEFWQGRPNRLHDRLRYRRAGDGWKIERLAP